MKLDSKGFNLLAECEGLKLEAYLCPAKVWTIGFGNTFYEDGKPVKKGDKITKDQAYKLFHLIESKYSGPINQLVKVDISQNQFNALFIFAWNVGPKGFRNSTLLKRVNAGCDDEKIKEAFLLWKGKNNLLLSRRLKEFKMFCS